MEKSNNQISLAAVVKKLHALEKKFFPAQKKSSQLICVDKTYKTVCGKYFKINGSRDIQFLLTFWFRKIVLHH